MTEEEKIYKYLQKVRVDKLPLENEIFAIRDSRKKINDYTIYVDGYISLDAINKNIEKINLIQKLQKENEKKDKIIDLMAECIAESISCDFINITDIECKNTQCKDCMKRYFDDEAEKLSSINTIQEEN